MKYILVALTSLWLGMTVTAQTEPKCLAKSKDNKIIVTFKEKYGPVRTYKDITLVLLFNSKYYVLTREGTVAVLQDSNWSIMNLEKKQ